MLSMCLLRHAFSLTKSPSLTPNFAAVSGCSHAGLLCTISEHHLRLAVRPWLCTFHLNEVMTSSSSAMPTCSSTWVQVGHAGRSYS